MLSKGHGDMEDHATLLCSLLLGFGLDAYVVVGKNLDGPYVWCLTKVAPNAVELWDSVTGQRYE